MPARAVRRGASGAVSAQRRPRRTRPTHRRSSSTRQCFPSPSSATGPASGWAVCLAQGKRAREARGTALSTVVLDSPCRLGRLCAVCSLRDSVCFILSLFLSFSLSLCLSCRRGMQRGGGLREREKKKGRLGCDFHLLHTLCSPLSRPLLPSPVSPSSSTPRHVAFQTRAVSVKQYARKWRRQAATNRQHRLKGQAKDQAMGNTTAGEEHRGGRLPYSARSGSGAHRGEDAAGGTRRRAAAGRTGQ